MQLRRLFVSSNSALLISSRHLTLNVSHLSIRFFELRQRFEAPNSSNRWDFPLFHVDMTPAGFDSRQFEAVLSGLASAAVSTPPSESLSAANQPPPVPVSGIIVEPVNKKPSAFRRTPRKTVEPSADPPAIDVEIGQLPVGELSVPITTVFTPKHQKLTFSGTVRDDYTASSASVIADTSENFLAEDASPEHCCELIRNFIKTAVAPAPNPATVATPHLKANMLYLLDKISQEVVTTIVNHQNISANATDPLLFTDYDRALELHRVVSLAELQRHRRQFVKVNAQIPPCNQIDIGSSFIEFLALHI